MSLVFKDAIIDSKAANKTRRKLAGLIRCMPNMPVLFIPSNSMSEDSGDMPCSILSVKINTVVLYDNKYYNNKKDFLWDYLIDNSVKTGESFNSKALVEDAFKLWEDASFEAICVYAVKAESAKND